MSSSNEGQEEKQQDQEQEQQQQQQHHCVFCNTSDPNLHVRYCGMCDKWMCDLCRPKYGMRMRAAVNEQFHKTTLTAEAIRQRARGLIKRH